MIDEQLDYLTRLSDDVRGFEVADCTIGALPDGVAPELLRDLWEVCIKFGSLLEPTMAGSLRVGFTLRNTLMMELVDARHLSDGVAGMTVVKHKPVERNVLVVEHGGVRMSTRVVEFMPGTICDLRNGLRITWDKALSEEDVEAAIRETDDLAAQAGEIVDGKRVPALLNEVRQALKARGNKDQQG